MQITDVRVKLSSGDKKMKATVSVTFDNAFVVRDIKVIEGLEKLFVAMPSRKLPDGEFKDIAHPINSETRTMIEEAVLEKYSQELEAAAAEISESLE